MKVKVFDRVLLALVLIIVIALCLALMLIAVRFVPVSDVHTIADMPYYNDSVAIALGAGALLMLIIAIRLMFAGGKAKQPKAEPAPSSTLVKTSDIGSTFIALSALDAMVQKHCKSISQIRAVTSAVHPVTDGGVTLNLRLSLLPDSCIPELTGALQQSLKEYVEGLSGIDVREIGILVEDTSTNPKARVD